MKCHGSCNGYTEELYRVHVLTWGKFIYCENAIAEDRKRGLRVLVLERIDNGTME